jgi:hypothetical protein
MCPHCARQDIARVLFEAFTPLRRHRGAVAAHHATMNAYARAAQPDTSDENSNRRRNTAIADSARSTRGHWSYERAIAAADRSGGVGGCVRTNGAVPPPRSQQTPLPTPFDLPLQIPALRPKDASGRAAYVASTAPMRTLGSVAAARKMPVIPAADARFNAKIAEMRVLALRAERIAVLLADLCAPLRSMC